MPRILLLATTTGYQTRAFAEAAESLAVDLVFATDRCHQLDDPWRDHAVPIRFHDEDGSVANILAAAAETPLDGVLAVGDRPTVIAAGVMRALGLPGHPPEAAAAARNKRATRDRFENAGLLVPKFALGDFSVDPKRLAAAIGFPSVVKPLALSASRGVMRVNDETELVAAIYRLRALLSSPDIRAERDEVHDYFLVEEFVEGHEFAVEGVMNHGDLNVLAIFDKPDPLDGPFFEETIYVTPPVVPPETQRDMAHAVRQAAAALGLYHGPVHAECRVNPRGVYVLEVAARPIGGLCARTLRFVRRHEPSRPGISLEELLLRHALGNNITPWVREDRAAGVMMIPIPRRGMFRGVIGLDAARAVPGVEDVRITAKIDQRLLPLPEGASYLGFIFARGDRAGQVDAALRRAHERLEFDIVPELRVLQSVHG